MPCCNKVSDHKNCFNCGLKGASLTCPAHPGIELTNGELACSLECVDEAEATTGVRRVIHYVDEFEIPGYGHGV